ncbi:hypothetical protein DENSPDRAFT_846089 [Dentipellis sp. KUC8613]|nr:hypothetical protein DENSPDRAFT_846089 [Dentipellis sp. KUC8613]
MPQRLVRRTRRFPAGTGEGSTSWYCTEGNANIPVPPDGLRFVEVADIYVHRNVETGRSQLWCFNKEQCWQPTYVGGEHPLLVGRRLQLRDNGEPSWVKPRSFSTMKSRSRYSQRQKL